MSRIIEQLEAIGVGNTFEFLHLAGIAIDMHGHNGRGTWSNKRFHLGRVKGKCIRLNVAEHWRAVVPVNCVCGGDKGEWRRYDFACYAQCLHPNLQGNHPIGEKRDILHSKVFRQFGLELAVEFAIVGEPFVVPYLFKIGNKLVQRGQRRRCDIDGHIQ